MADLLGSYIHTTLLINVSLDKLHTVCFDSFCGCSGFDLLIKKQIYNLLWILDEASLGFSINSTEMSMEIWVDVVFWNSIYTCIDMYPTSDHQQALYLLQWVPLHQQAIYEW